MITSQKKVNLRKKSKNLRKQKLHQNLTKSPAKKVNLINRLKNHRKKWKIQKNYPKSILNQKLRRKLLNKKVRKSRKRNTNQKLNQ